MMLCCLWAGSTILWKHVISINNALLAVSRINYTLSACDRWRQQSLWPWKLTCAIYGKLNHCTSYNNIADLCFILVKCNLCSLTWPLTQGQCIMIRKYVIAQSMYDTVQCDLWSLIQKDMGLQHSMCDMWYMWLLRWMWQCDIVTQTNVWSVIAGLTSAAAAFSAPQCVMCDLWSAPQCVMPVCAPMCTNVHQCAPMCSPMCDAASQLVVRTNRPNIDPPFVRCAQYRKYRPAISPRFDGKEYFCPQKSANLCQSITVRHMISHLYQLIFSQSYHKSSSVTAKQKESVFWEWVNILL